MGALGDSGAVESAHLLGFRIMALEFNELFGGTVLEDGFRELVRQVTEAGEFCG
jgi:hypothetical protein